MNQIGTKITTNKDFITNSSYQLKLIAEMVETKGEIIGNLRAVGFKDFLPYFFKPPVGFIDC